MAEYMLLIWDDERAWEAADDRTLHDTLQAHGQFIERNRASLLGGNRLHPSATATSIRRGGGGQGIVTDGSFAETKEVIGGYYLIEAPDLDAAIQLALQVPAPFGGVEIRPVWPTD